MTVKFTYEDVYNYFTEQKCELLETEYINSSTKMKYKCICKNISFIFFSKFKQGQRCKKCNGKETYTYEYVTNFFQKQDCKLLETEYINNITNMNYICKCGNINNIKFSQFKNDKKCQNCLKNTLTKLELIRNEFLKKRL